MQDCVLGFTPKIDFLERQSVFVAATVCYHFTDFYELANYINSQSNCAALSEYC